METIFTRIKKLIQDNKQQLREVKEKISKTKLRLDEAEEWILDTEKRMLPMKEVMEELIKLQTLLETKQLDQQGRSRWNKIRICSLEEGLTESLHQW